MKTRHSLLFLILVISSYLCVFHQLFDASSNRFNLIDYTEDALDLKFHSVFNKNQRLELSFDAQNYMGLQKYLYDTNLTGKGVTVAILDTGIYPNHHIFTGDGSHTWDERIIAFYDENIDDLNSNPYDIQWHGTWTASILGGASSTYQGVAPNVNLLVMKVFYEKNGEITSTIPTLEKAIDWIVENNEAYNIRVVSMSFGADSSGNQEELRYLHLLMDKLTDENILVVAAAGNDGNEEGSITAPASESSVLAVGGVDFYGNMYSKSGAGPTFEGLTKPDVCAPAISIEGAEVGTIDQYSQHTGTSGAAPFVSGLAALMLEKNPDLHWTELKNIISLSSVRSIDPYKIKDNTQGWGIIQGYAALSALESPIKLQQNTNIKFSLNGQKRAFCLPIKLDSGHWFMELSELSNGKAEMYLFDQVPDNDGNPKLLSHTLLNLEFLTDLKRLGIFTPDRHEYYLVIKLINGYNDENFSIRLIIDYRTGFILLILSINTISLIINIRYYKNLKKSFS